MRRPFEYPQPTRYSNKVLIGPWHLNRLNAKPPVQENQTYSTTYNTEHSKKTLTKRDENMAWNQIMNAELSFAIPVDGEEFNDNFSTSYDLSYNHIPKCYKKQIPRVWHLLKASHEPTDEYLCSYGNVTESRLRREKLVQWNYDRNDPRRSASTSYHCQFKPPKNESYKFKRFVLPKANLEYLSQEEIDGFKEKRRFCATHNVVKSTQMEVQKRNFCNPISWQCSEDNQKK